MTAEHKHGDGTPRWVIGIGLGLVLVATLVAGAFIIWGGERSPSSDRPAATQWSEKKAPAGDMTPPPAEATATRDCPPPIEVVPPRAHGPVAASPLKQVREPREGVDFITLPQREGSYELDMPAPGAGGTTIPVRFMPGGGYYLHSKSWPATVKAWKMEEWREGPWLYRRWAHLDGEVNGFAEKVQITIDGNRN